MLKFTVSEVPVNSIIWRADLTKPSKDGETVQTYSGAIEADEIDEEEFARALFDMLKCEEGQMQISLMRGGCESKFNMEAFIDEEGCLVDSSDCIGGDCPDFVIGHHAESLRLAGA